MNKKKYPQFTLRIDQETLSQLQDIANSQDRSLAKVIKMALDKYLAEQPKIAWQHNPTSVGFFVASFRCVTYVTLVTIIF